MISLINVEFYRFFFVGVGANLINYAIYLFFYWIGMPLFIASTAGYVAGLLCSYHFGRLWVFGNKFNINKGNVFRFLAVYTVGGLIMCGLIEVLVRTSVMSYQKSWLAGAAFTMINNFFGLKKFVFNRGISK